MSSHSSTRRQAKIIEFPDREFVVEVTYTMRMRHLVRAASVEEAERLAPDAAIASDIEVVDIVNAITLRELPRP